MTPRWPTRSRTVSDHCAPLIRTYDNEIVRLDARIAAMFKGHPGYETIQQLPEDAQGDVWDQASGGEGVDLDEMRAAQQPGSGEPGPDNLLPDPEEDIHVVVMRSPTVDEVLDELPDQVRTQVEQERIEQATAAARHAAGLDRVEEAVRRAMSAGDANRVQSILRGLDPDDAEAVSRSVQQSFPTR